MCHVGFAQQTNTDTKGFNADFISLCTKKNLKKQQQKKQYSHFKNIFNVGFNPTSLYIHVHEKSGVQFWVCMTNIDTKIFSAGLNALRTKMKK